MEELKSEGEKVIPPHIIEAAFQAGMKADPEPRTFVTAILRAGLDEIARSQMNGQELTYMQPEDDSDELLEMTLSIKASILEALMIPPQFLADEQAEALDRMIRSTIQKAKALADKSENES